MKVSVTEFELGSFHLLTITLKTVNSLLVWHDLHLEYFSINKADIWNSKLKYRHYLMINSDLYHYTRCFDHYPSDQWFLRPSSDISHSVVHWPRTIVTRRPIILHFPLSKQQPPVFLLTSLTTPACYCSSRQLSLNSRLFHLHATRDEPHNSNYNDSLLFSDQVFKTFLRQRY